MSTPVVHEIYAVKFARNDAPTRGHLMLGAAAEPRDAPMPLDYFVWAITSPESVVVVDAGFTELTNGPRPRKLLERPGAALSRFGVDPAAVPIVVLTHFHNDHVGDLEAFPAATFVAQRVEYDYWTGEDAWTHELSKHAERSDVARLVELHDDGRLQLVDGTTEIVEGVAVHRVGGHTPGMQIVEVLTARGRVVLASDAAHFFENVEERHPTAVNLDTEGASRALDRMTRFEDALVVAGHDPALFDRFPAVPGLEGRALRIA